MNHRAGKFAARNCGLLALLIFAAGQMFAASPFESNAALTPQNKIDELVFARLQKLQITPAPLCSDPVFIRRVYLDVIGTLPSATEGERKRARRVSYSERPAVVATTRRIADAVSASSDAPWPSATNRSPTARA